LNHLNTPVNTGLQAFTELAANERFSGDRESDLSGAGVAEAAGAE
jgi:hypothetical protein